MTTAERFYFWAQKVPGLNPAAPQIGIGDPCLKFSDNVSTYGTSRILFPTVTRHVGNSSSLLLIPEVDCILSWILSYHADGVNYYKSCIESCIGNGIRACWTSQRGLQSSATLFQNQAQPLLFVVPLLSRNEFLNPFVGLPKSPPHLCFWK